MKMTTYLPIFIAFTLYSVSPLFGQENHLQAQVIINEAKQLLDQGKIAEAIEKLENQLTKESDPQHLHIFHEILGDIYTQMRKIDKAVAHYDKILAMNPKDGAIYFKKGYALKHQIAKILESTEALKKSFELGFSHPELFATLGSNFRVLAEMYPSDQQARLEAHQLAVYFLEMTLEQQSDHINALNNLADIRYNAGDFQEAKKLYQRLYELLPDNMNNTNKLAHTHIALKEFDQALAILRQNEKKLAQTKMSLERFLPDGQVNVQGTFLWQAKIEVDSYLAELLMKQKKYAEARQYLERVLEATDFEHQKPLKPVTRQMLVLRTHAQKQLKEIQAIEPESPAQK